MIESLFSVSGRAVLVTGGAHGLGRMIASAFAEAGAEVYLTSRRTDDATRTAEEIGATGLIADLSSAEGCSDLAARFAALAGRLHILVNNAGRTWGSPLESFPEKGWASVLPINVQAPFTLVRDLLPLLEQSASAHDPARVINIGSIAGRVVEPLSAYSYGASKAALHHLTRMMAAELAGRRINVNCIVPGYFPTDMTGHMRSDAAQLGDVLARIPLGRMGEASDIAGACLLLASRAGAYMTGTELVVDGGLSGCR